MAMKMAMKKNAECCQNGGVCGLHLCKCCAGANIIFGLLFLVLGFGVWTAAPDYFNFPTLVGFYVLILGLVSLMKKKCC